MATLGILESYLSDITSYKSAPVEMLINVKWIVYLLNYNSC